MFLVETPRLLLREMTIADAESAYLLNADPEVIQYTGDKAFASVEEAKQFLSNYNHYKKYGYGRWAMILKETDGFLGWCGLKYLEDDEKFDLGYRLMKKYWNKGYATEAARKSLELGFNQFNMDSIAGHADIQNLASIHVLQKVGMSYQSNYFEGERECASYKIDKEEFKK